MSFSSEAKIELCRDEMQRPCCVRAEAYGVLLYCNTFSPREVRIITENKEFARRVPLLLCRVLDHLHRPNPPVIHRDIKPQNIIIDKDGGCRLIDLGTARRFRSEQPDDTQLMGTH